MGNALRLARHTVPRLPLQCSPPHVVIFGVIASLVDSDWRGECTGSGSAPSPRPGVHVRHACRSDKARELRKTDGGEDALKSLQQPLCGDRASARHRDLPMLRAGLHPTGPPPPPRGDGTAGSAAGFREDSLDSLLQMCGFQEVPEEFIREADEEEGKQGLNVHVPPAKELPTRVYYRGLVEKEVPHPCISRMSMHEHAWTRPGDCTPHACVSVAPLTIWLVPPPFSHSKLAVACDFNSSDNRRCRQYRTCMARPHILPATA